MLHGAYLLFGGTFIGLGPLAVVTIVVFGATTAASYYAERRFGLFVGSANDK